jgi:prepilin-type N-terminal cleavage/methylation domain-containing protein
VRKRTGQEGFGLIELVVVAAVMGLLLALAVPSFADYQRRQQARSQAQRIADALGQARSLAIKEGNPYFVVFTDTGTVQVVDDDNGDYQIGGGELTVDVDYAAGSSTQVTYYGAIAGPPAATATAEDGGGAIPSTGTTFPDDVATGFPAVGFTAQGFPVSLPAVVGDPPGDPGSGGGSYYVTDNDNAVYAVTLLPLGGIRVRVFRPTIGDWF